MLTLTIILKLVVGLIALLIVVRLLGKKELSQATPFDLVYLLVLGGILEESLYDDNVNPFHLLTAIALWCGMIYIIEVIVRKKEKGRSLIKGRAVMLIEDSEMKVQRFIDNKMEIEQFRSLLRQQNIFSLSDITYAILETSGNISIISTEQNVSQPSILLADTGEFVKADLDHTKDENWIRELLHQEGYNNVKNIFCAEWSAERGLYIVLYPDKHK